MTRSAPTTEIEIDGKCYAVPNRYVCPLSLDIMTNPMVSRSGHRFERAMIQAWLAKEGENPLTREKMSLYDLIPDIRLEDEIRFWRKSNDLLSMNCSSTSDDDEIANKDEYDGIVLLAPILDKSAFVKQARHDNRRSIKRLFRFRRCGGREPIAP